MLLLCVFPISIPYQVRNQLDHQGHYRLSLASSSYSHFQVSIAAPPTYYCSPGHPLLFPQAPIKASPHPPALGVRCSSHPFHLPPDLLQDGNHNLITTQWMTLKTRILSQPMVLHFVYIWLVIVSHSSTPFVYFLHDSSAIVS